MPQNIEIETDEEFAKRLSTLTDAEIGAEFHEKHKELVMKYKCDYYVKPLEIEITRLNFPK